MPQQIGGATGLAIVTAVATSQGRGTGPIGLTTGFRAALLVSAGIATAAIIASITVLPRRVNGTTDEPVAVTVP